jgi:hypothetical protein
MPDEDDYRLVYILQCLSALYYFFQPAPAAWKEISERFVSFADCRIWALRMILGARGGAHREPIEATGGEFARGDHRRCGILGFAPV